MHDELRDTRHGLRHQSDEAQKLLFVLKRHDRDTGKDAEQHHRGYLVVCERAKRIGGDEEPEKVEARPCFDEARAEKGTRSASSGARVER